MTVVSDAAEPCIGGRNRRPALVPGPDPTPPPSGHFWADTASAPTRRPRWPCCASWRTRPAVAMVRTRFARLGERWWVDTRERLLAGDAAQHAAASDGLRAEAARFANGSVLALSTYPPTSSSFPRKREPRTAGTERSP